MGIRLIIYLDDILIMHQEKKHLMHLIPLVFRFLDALGLMVNTVDSVSENRILGLPCQLSLSAPGLPTQETEEDSPGCQLSPKEGSGVSQRSSKVCGKDHSLSTCHMAGPIALQGSAEHDQLCCSTRSIPGEHGEEVQYNCEPHQGGQERSHLVVLSGQSSAINSGIPIIPLRFRYGHRIRCLQHKLGSPTGRNSDGRQMVDEGSLKPHQLP